MSNISFCPNCNNILDITKSTGQVGGAKDEQNDQTSDSESSTEHQTSKSLVQKLLQNYKIDSETVSSMDLDDIVKSDEYKKLDVDQKEYVFNKIQDLKPSTEKKESFEKTVTKTTDKAYFICNSCGYLKPIEEGALIFSRVSSDIVQNYAGSEVNDMKFSSILPRTRKYICPNKKCESHNDDSKREAVFFRLNNTYRIKYICLACDVIF